MVHVCRGGKTHFPNARRQIRTFSSSQSEVGRGAFQTERKNTANNRAKQSTESESNDAQVRA